MKINPFLFLLMLLPASLFAADLQPDVAIESDRQHVVINIPQLRLFVYENGKLLRSNQIAVGKNKTKTPIGEYEIGAKAFDPTWYVPLSIQKENAAAGRAVVKTIPPGPNNPLGPVFVRFGAPKLGLGIHGTSAPSSVPGVRSHGCVRMKSPEALQFAKNINKGAKVSVIYQMAVLNEDNNQNLWLAVYNDPYIQKNLSTEQLKSAISTWAQNSNKTVNEARLTAVIKNRSGSANCLTCTENSTKLPKDVKLTPIRWLSDVPTQSEKEDENTLNNNEPVVQIEDNGADTANTDTGEEVKPLNQDVLF